MVASEEASPVTLIDKWLSRAVGEKERPICHRLLRDVRLQLAWQRFSRFLMTGALM